MRVSIEYSIDHSVTFFASLACRLKQHTPILSLHHLGLKPGVADRVRLGPHQHRLNGSMLGAGRVPGGNPGPGGHAAVAPPASAPSGTTTKACLKASLVLLVETIQCFNMPTSTVSSLAFLLSLCGGGIELAFPLFAISTTPATFLCVFSFENADVKVIWCLANVAGDGASARAALLQAGTLRPFLVAIANPTSQDHLRTAAWYDAQSLSSDLS